MKNSSRVVVDINGTKVEAILMCKSHTDENNYIVQFEFGELSVPSEKISLFESESTDEAVELPKNWGDLSSEDVQGYWINEDCCIRDTCPDEVDHDEDRNIYATREQAEASIALAMLSQLVKKYNESEPLPEYKYGIETEFFGKEFKVNALAPYEADWFLSFNSKELAEHFLENHKELLEKAKPLM